MVCVFGGCKVSVWFFFFKQKTAYEVRISDWSSDVCSSDLADVALREPDAADHDDHGRRERDGALDHRHDDGAETAGVHVGVEVLAVGLIEPDRKSVV